MECSDVREEFSALLDNELDAEKREAIEAHLSQCSDCLQQLEELRKVGDLYCGLETQQAPVGMHEQIMAQLNAKPVVHFKRRRSKRKTLWPLLAAAAMLVFVIGATMFMLQAKPGQIMTASRDEKSESGTRIKQLQDISAIESVPENLDGVENAPPPEPSEESFYEDVPAAQSRPTQLFRREPEAKKEYDIASSQRKFNTWEEPTAKSADDRHLSYKTSPEGINRLEALGYGEEVSDASKPEREVISTGDSISLARRSPLPPQVLKEKTEIEGSRELDDLAYTREDNERNGFMGARQEQLQTQDMPASEPAVIPPPVIENRMMATKGLRKDSRADDESVETEKEINNLIFSLKAGVWIQSDYNDEELTLVSRNSEELRHLLKKHRELAAILELGEKVIFKLGDIWYKVEPAKDSSE